MELFLGIFVRNSLLREFNRTARALLRACPRMYWTQLRDYPARLPAPMRLPQAEEATPNDINDLAFA